MGNQLKSCVDCGGGNKSLTTTDTPSGEQFTRAQKLLQKGIKTPQLRAQGLVDLNYSDLPQMIVEKRNKRIQQIKEMHDTYGEQSGDESLSGEKSLEKHQQALNETVSVNNISFNYKHKFDNIAAAGSLTPNNLSLSRSAETQQEGDLSQLIVARKLSHFAKPKRNDTFGGGQGLKNCSVSYENLLEPINYHRLISPQSSQKSECMRDALDLNDRLSQNNDDDQRQEWEQAEPNNVIKFDQEDLVDVKWNTQDGGMLASSNLTKVQSELVMSKNQMMAKYGDKVLDLEITSCQSLSTIQAAEEQKSASTGNLFMTKQNSNQGQKKQLVPQGGTTRVLIEGDDIDKCVHCMSCIKGVSIKSLQHTPFIGQDCDLLSAEGIKENGTQSKNQKLEKNSPKSPCLLKQRLMIDNNFDDETFNCPFLLDINKVPSSQLSSQNGSTSSFLTREGKKMGEEENVQGLKSGSSSSLGLGSELKVTKSSLIQQRKAQVKAKMSERRQKILINKEYKMNRRETINKVSIVLQRLIEQFHHLLNISDECNQKHEMNLASLIFNEQIFLEMPKKLTNQNSLGFYFGVKKRQKGLTTQQCPSALQVSLYSYENDPEFPLVKGQSAPTQKAVEQFINKIFLKMRLTNEVCLLAFIFIERLIKKSDVRILNFNWKPIVYISIMIASKYWDDISFWNIDFVETLPQFYSLAACNQLESTFLAMCGYELYVSETLYDEYYDAIIRHTTSSDNQETQIESEYKGSGATDKQTKMSLHTIQEEGLSSS